MRESATIPVLSWYITSVMMPYSWIHRTIRTVNPQVAPGSSVGNYAQPRRITLAAYWYSQLVGS